VSVPHVINLGCHTVDDFPQPPEDDAAAEAAIAIAQTHTLEAFQLLCATFAKTRDHGSGP
jgi:hypothetical protein